MSYNSLVPLKRSSVGPGTYNPCDTTCHSETCCKQAPEACAASYNCPNNCKVDDNGDCAYNKPGSAGCFIKNPDGCMQIGTGSCSALDCKGNKDTDGGECENSTGGCFDGEGAEDRCNSGSLPNACGGKHNPPSGPSGDQPDMPTMRKVFATAIMSQNSGRSVHDRVREDQANCVFDKLFAGMSPEEVSAALQASSPPQHLTESIVKCKISNPNGLAAAFGGAPSATKYGCPISEVVGAPCVENPNGFFSSEELCNNACGNSIPPVPSPPGHSPPSNNFFATTMGKILIIFMALLVAMGLVLLVHHLSVKK